MRWTDTELDDLRHMYADQNISRKQLEEHFGRRIGTIKQQAHYLCIKRPRTDLWNSEEIALVEQLYPNEDISRDEIECRIGHTWKSVVHVAQRLWLSRAKPNTIQAKRDYFKAIDSDEKAYWLGFIAADGVVVNTGRNYSIVLDLQPRDRHWLEKFRDTLAPGASITVHGTRSCSVCIGSKELTEDITALGITPRKSNTLGWPKLPEPFVTPFLLSYFDGDGSLQRRKDRGGGFLRTLIGTLPFLATA